MNSLIEEIRKRKKDRSKLKKFLKGLSKRKVRGLDSLAKNLHTEAFEKIDCLQCANCCKTMTPTWKKAEVKRVAAGMGLTYDSYFEKYLKVDKEGDILNRSTPCQHLAPDNKCMIYEIRPSDCSGYPHTNKRKFTDYIPDTHIQNMDYCPAAFYIVDKMFEKIGKK